MKPTKPYLLFLIITLTIDNTASNPVLYKKTSPDAPRVFAVEVDPEAVAEADGNDQHKWQIVNG